jgi:hypothetical protein
MSKKKIAAIHSPRDRSHPHPLTTIPQVLLMRQSPIHADRSLLTNVGKAYRVTQMGGSVRLCAWSRYKNSLSDALRRTVFFFIKKSIGLFLLTSLRYGARNKGDTMSSIRYNRRSNFGVTCGQCGHELIAPEWSEYHNERHVHHVWRCWKCDCCFETIVDTKTTHDII